jgi:hypothetical protein
MHSCNCDVLHVSMQVEPFALGQEVSSGTLSGPLGGQGQGLRVGDGQGQQQTSYLTPERVKPEARVR